MTDVFDDLAKAFKAGHDAGRSEAADEIERLRSTLDQTRRFALSGEMDTLVSDEIERLREALRKISNMGQTNVPDHWDFRVKAREIARAALGEKE